jgi:hypothetical protein
MKSVRLEPELQARLKRAAELIGCTESEVIRSAVGLRVDAILGREVPQGWGGFVGKIHGGGTSRGRNSHRRFTELLRRDHQKRKAKPRARL